MARISKYNYGDTVAFTVGGQMAKGVIKIIDPNGTWEANQFSEVSYDIQVDSESMLYKHVPESVITKVDSSLSPPR